jgi:hypothetical protein
MKSLGWALTYDVCCLCRRVDYDTEMYQRGLQGHFEKEQGLDLRLLASGNKGKLVSVI